MEFYNNELKKFKRDETKLEITYELENEKSLLMRCKFLNTYNNKKYFLSNNIPSEDFYKYLLTTNNDEEIVKNGFPTNSTTIIFRLKKNEEVLMFNEIRETLNKILEENNSNILKINNILKDIDEKITIKTTNDYK